MSSMPKTPVPEWRESARLLVADADPVTRRLLASIGGSESYQIVSVEDGARPIRR